MICVYAIVNLINGKKYIGSTKNFYIRKKGHLNALFKNKHHSVYLQNAWNKYGEENFKFVILEKLAEGDTYFKEQEYLDKYKTYNSKHGYNMSATAKGGRPTNSFDGVVQYSLGGEKLSEFRSAMGASRMLKLTHSSILNSCNEKTRRYGKYLFLFQKDDTIENRKRRLEKAQGSFIRPPEFGQAISIRNTGKQFSVNALKNMGEAQKNRDKSSFNTTGLVNSIKKCKIEVYNLEGLLVDEFPSERACIKKYSYLSCKGCKNRSTSHLKFIKHSPKSDT